MQGKILAFAFMLFAGMLSAQVEAPAPSPMGKIEQKVGLTDITIEYSRPGMKNRVIFGDLVPYDQMWRTGANASTKITFSDNVTVGGVELEKGTYAIYAVPGETEWEFVFYKDLTHWGVPKEWDATQEAARFTVESEEIPWTVETMSIDINNLRDESARVNFMWESTLVGFDLGVSTDDKVMASIEKTLAGPGRGDFYNAAKYYYTAEKDLDEALTWVRKANEIEEKFWQLRLQSLIEAKLGDKTTAISTATKSMMLAEKAGYDNYVRMNKASIAEWLAEGAEEDSEVPEGED